MEKCLIYCILLILYCVFFAETSNKNSWIKLDSKELTEENNVRLKVSSNMYLQFNENCVELIRREYNMSNAARFSETIRAFEDWIQKQGHFNKKEFDQRYLERVIYLCKGSLEQAKTQLDKLCTIKTMMPKYFVPCNVKNDLVDIYKNVSMLVLPKQTEDCCRVYLLKCHDLQKNPPPITDMIKFNICLAEYTLFNDLHNGYFLVFDLLDINPMDIIVTYGINVIKELVTIFIGTYRMRVRGIHIISTSKLIDTLVGLIKQVLSPKLGKRLHVHQKYEELYSILPRRILPKDYGGEDMSIHELQDNIIDVLSDDANMKNITDIYTASTNESLRQSDKFSEQYAGMPGTFRILSVD